MLAFRDEGGITVLLLLLFALHAFAATETNGRRTVEDHPLASSEIQSDHDGEPPQSIVPYDPGMISTHGTLDPNRLRPIKPNLTRDYFGPKPKPHPRTTPDHTVTQHLQIVSQTPIVESEHRLTPETVAGLETPQSHSPQSTSSNGPLSKVGAAKEKVRECVDAACKPFKDVWHATTKPRTTYSATVGPAVALASAVPAGAGVVALGLTVPGVAPAGSAAVGTVAMAISAHNLGTSAARVTAHVQEMQNESFGHGVGAMNRQTNDWIASTEREFRLYPPLDNTPREVARARRRAVNHLESSLSPWNIRGTGVIGVAHPREVTSSTHHRDALKTKTLTGITSKPLDMISNYYLRTAGAHKPEIHDMMLKAQKLDVRNPQQELADRLYRAGLKHAIPGLDPYPKQIPPRDLSPPPPPLRLPPEAEERRKKRAIEQGKSVSDVSTSESDVSSPVRVRSSRGRSVRDRGHLLASTSDVHSHSYWRPEVSPPASLRAISPTGRRGFRRGPSPDPDPRRSDSRSRSEHSDSDGNMNERRSLLSSMPRSDGLRSASDHEREQGRHQSVSSRPGSLRFPPSPPREITSGTRRGGRRTTLPTHIEQPEPRGRARTRDHPLAQAARSEDNGSSASKSSSFVHSYQSLTRLEYATGSHHIVYPDGIHPMSMPIPIRQSSRDTSRPATPPRSQSYWNFHDEKRSSSSQNQTSSGNTQDNSRSTGDRNSGLSRSTPANTSSNSSQRQKSKSSSRDSPNSGLSREQYPAGADRTGTENKRSSGSGQPSHRRSMPPPMPVIQSEAYTSSQHGSPPERSSPLSPQGHSPAPARQLTQASALTQGLEGLSRARPLDIPHPPSHDLHRPSSSTQPSRQSGASPSSSHDPFSGLSPFPKQGRTKTETEHGRDHVRDDPRTRSSPIPIAVPSQGRDTSIRKTDTPPSPKAMRRDGSRGSKGSSQQALGTSASPSRQAPAQTLSRASPHPLQRSGSEGLGSDTDAVAERRREERRKRKEVVDRVKAKRASTNSLESLSGANGNGNGNGKKGDKGRKKDGH